MVRLTSTQDSSVSGLMTSPAEGSMQNQVEELRVEHVAAVEKTKAYEMKPKTKFDLRNRARKMMDWMMKEYPERSKTWVRNLTEEEMKSGKFHKNTHNFIYEKIEVEFIQAFLSSEVHSNKNGKQYSERLVTKFHDALVHGAKQAGVELHRLHTTKMKPFKYL